MSRYEGHRKHRKNPNLFLCGRFLSFPWWVRTSWHLATTCSLVSILRSQLSGCTITWERLSQLSALLMLHFPFPASSLRPLAEESLTEDADHRSSLFSDWHRFLSTSSMAWQTRFYSSSFSSLFTGWSIH